MGLSIGIVGLPNVGKSTFFQVLTKNKTALIANYPFATINPNIGVVQLEDKRTIKLQEIYKSKKIVPNFIKFIDIAGLVKGASEGKGLGNKFLSNIKETDVICNVVRCFVNKDILHVENRLDPIEDIKIINLELILDDLKNINNLSNSSLKKMKFQDTKQYDLLIHTIAKAKKILEEERLLSSITWNEQEINLLKSLNLLTLKKCFYVINVSENDWKNLNENEMYKTLIKYLDSHNLFFVTMPLKFEHDLIEIHDDEKEFYKEMYDIKESTVNQIIKLGFDLLSLKTFFTCGPEEIYAWTFKNGTNAKDAAGLIHTDIKEGFIKAEIFKTEDILKYLDVKKIKEAGLCRIEGKEYLMEDGDIAYFHFNKKGK